MAMAFMINARIASIYLIAVIFLGSFLVFIMKKATKYFREVFEKYDDLNASVQENISAVRVVKAYVREEYETTKFQKACNKVYEMFVRAEKLVVMNMLFCIQNIIFKNHLFFFINPISENKDTVSLWNVRNQFLFPVGIFG